MKKVEKMTYKELEAEVDANRCEMSTASSERKRVLIRRNHELLVEIDARWNRLGEWWNRASK